MVYRNSLVFIIAVLVMFCGCARHTGTPVRVGSGMTSLDMKAENFKFEPSTIQANQGDVLTVNIHNTSGESHNFTLKDPDGNIVQSVDIPSHGSAQVRISLAKAGTYPFYCDKPLHSSLGMKGRIEVGPR